MYSGILVLANSADTISVTSPDGARSGERESIRSGVSVGDGATPASPQPLHVYVAAYFRAKLEENCRIGRAVSLRSTFVIMYGR